MLDTTWMAEGKCREHPPEKFFPSDGAGVEIAKRICADCPVLESCLEYALFHNIEHGVWGGASERARGRIARDRRSLARNFDLTLSSSDGHLLLDGKQTVVASERNR